MELPCYSPSEQGKVSVFDLLSGAPASSLSNQVIAVVVDAKLKVAELLHLAEVAGLRRAAHLSAALVVISGAPLGREEEVPNWRAKCNLKVQAAN